MLEKYHCLEGGGSGRLGCRFGWIARGDGERFIGLVKVNEGL